MAEEEPISWEQIVIITFIALTLIVLLVLLYIAFLMPTISQQ